MNVAEIDRLLAAWRRNLNTVAQNLTELHTHPCYQRLAGSPGCARAVLTGLTAAKVDPAVNAMCEMFQHFDQLTGLIKDCEDRRRGMKFLIRQDELNAIEAALTGPSIQLPSTEIPLDARSLLSEAYAGHTITPAVLLQSMTKSFDEVRTLVIEVDGAWQRLGNDLDAAENEIKALESLTAILNVPKPRELMAMRTRIQETRARVLSDPLGTSVELESLRPVISRIGKELETQAALLRKVQEGIAIARDTLRDVEELNGKIREAMEQSKLKVTEANAPAEPVPDAELEALRAWLARLEKRGGEGLLAPVSIGLEKWQNSAESLRRRERQILKENEAPLLERRELRGRLLALRAKAQARGRCEDTELVEVATEAEKWLYQRPTPVKKAAALVARYEAILNRTAVGASKE